MKFLIDNQLPIKLSKSIKSWGFESLHVQELNLDKSSDQVILDYANLNHCILVSKDEDFFHMLSQSSYEVTLIWVRIGNCRTNFLLNYFEQALPKILEHLRNKENIIQLL